MLQQAAIEYQSYGLQAVPSRHDKRPTGAWQSLQSTMLTTQGLIDWFNTHQQDIGGIGVICGKVSGGLEVIDVDCKYDLTGELYPNLKRLIDDNLSEISDTLVIGSTRSGGYHIYYRAADIAGNQKLARRPTSADELARNPHEKVKVLIETRGEGGFIVTTPSPGYALVQGSFSAIPTLTAEQRTILFTICRSFNEEPEVEPVRPQEPKAKQSGEGLSPFADYNQRGDVIDLLTRHGWSTVNRQGQRIHLKRPGDSDAKTSGNFHEGLRKFYVFSSSTEFEAEKAHSPSDVYILLECHGDKSRASKELREMGYGTSEPIRRRATKIKVEHVVVEIENENGEEDETETITKDGELTQEAIREAKGETIYVRYTAKTPRIEVINALDMIERTRPTIRLYALEVESRENPRQVDCLRPYEFRAKHIFESYAELYTANNNYVSPEQEDALINEYITVGQSLKEPFDRDRFRTLFLRFSEHNDLGITAATIEAKMEQLRFSLEKEQQSNELHQLLNKTEDLRQKGDLGKALSELASKSHEISMKAKSEVFKGLTATISLRELMERMSKKPNDLLTGIAFGEGDQREEVRLGAGALSIIAAPTNHGKTTMLVNLALKACEDLPKEKNVYILGLEESADPMLVRAMNTFINEELSHHNVRTINNYLKGQEAYFLNGKKHVFETKMVAFFEKLIYTGRLNIQYVQYDSDTLIDAVYYLHKSGNAGAVFIDYIQLLRIAGDRFNNRADELARICNNLKDAAVETNLPIILAAQFNRKVTNPLMMHPTNISDGSDIEKSAAVVLAMWNNNKKMIIGENDRKVLESTKNYYEESNTMYIELLKNRYGKTDGCSGMFNYNGNIGLIKGSSPQFFYDSAKSQGSAPLENPFSSSRRN